MTNELSTTLLACQNPNPTIRTQAEQLLLQAEQHNYPQFTASLVHELANEDSTLLARQLSGILFKNLLTSNDPSQQQQKLQKWKQLDLSSRATLQPLLLQTLCSSHAIVRTSAAQACAAVATLELPTHTWPEFISTLMEYVTSQKPDEVKISTLECLGFTCERLACSESAHNIGKDISDGILTTIVDGIRSSRPDCIRLAAARALLNSLVFARKNMENSTERNVIVQTLCAATQSSERLVRAMAYQCLVEIVQQYYHVLQDYMLVLFQLSLATIKEDEEMVALQAMEFWCSLCEEELDLLQCGKQSMGYVKGATPQLIPLVLESLVQKEEPVEFEEETWNMSMSAATLLTLMAVIVGDELVSVVLPFVQQHIQSDQWNYKEAGTMAFGSIMEGPSVEAIGPYVEQSIPVLLAAMADSHVLVKDTTAWTIAQLCEFHVRSIPHTMVPNLVQQLMDTLLKDAPRVSSQACVALHNLAASVGTAQATASTNALTPYMQPLLQILFQVVDRQDASENNLRVVSFATVCSLVQHSAPDCKHLLIQLLPAIVTRLHVTCSASVLTIEEKEQKEGLQGLLSGILQVISTKLSKEDVTPFANDMMSELLPILQSKHATSHEEAFGAISAICHSLELDFTNYMGTLAPLLLKGLNTFEAYDVCIVAVGLVGDIARSIEHNIQPYCDGIMTALITVLQSDQVHRAVKPPVLSCFGDIAMAIGTLFEPYLQITMSLIHQASQAQATDDDNDEFMYYINQLRLGIIEAYTGIIYGMKSGNRVDLMVPHTEAMMQFLERLSDDAYRQSDVVAKAAGLVGDIACALGSTVKQHLEKPFISNLIHDAYNSQEQCVMETCQWAKCEVQTVLSV